LNPYLFDVKTKRRDKLSIIAEILEIAKNGTLKTQIMYRANLSFAQLSEYLIFMKNANLLQQFNTGKDVYATTEKGKDFLKRHGELSKLIEEHEMGVNGVKIPPLELLRKK
jgi:predicted transcriptional regulator